MLNTKKVSVYLFILIGLLLSNGLHAQTIALWLFDEQIGLYPSCALSDAGPNDFPMVLGQGGQIVEGKFGNALEPTMQEPIQYPEESVKFGLKQLPVPAGRTVEPMSWMNAKFCGLMTSGENHLRKEIRFKQATATKLNLGDFDWTVEFWYQPIRETDKAGIVFEIGEGPRGENNQVTQLMVNEESSGFVLLNQTSDTRLFIPSQKTALKNDSNQWHHFVFVYSASENQLRHYVDGKEQKLPEKCELKSLAVGDEDYFSVGRDALWNRPLPGKLDELRFSEGQVYGKNFSPPQSLSPDQWQDVDLKKGLPLLFAGDNDDKGVVNLGSRKHLFIDDAFIQKMENVEFTANPPRLDACVIDSIEGPFRKHLSVVEDENGLLRLYYGGPDDYVEVQTSADGIHWEKPDLGKGLIKGRKNIAISEPSAMGNVFFDPNEVPEAKWKYVSGFQERGIFVFYSPDGWHFNRAKTAAIPIRAGSQSNVFYDEQQQAYIGYHRSDFAKTIGGDTQRQFGITVVTDIMSPFPFDPVTQKETWEAAKDMRLRNPQPWYLDNGPLTPGGLGIEYPIVFAPKDTLDPRGSDIYVPKAIKYPWAPDTYLAFPLLYLHYEDGPLTRQVLQHPDRRRGSGPIETQLSVSRDAVNWKRYPKPVYVGNGQFGKHHINQSYLAHGMVKRNNEIWQYCFCETRYHSTWLKDGEYVRAVYRFIQRLDRFVSIDTPYDEDGFIVTRPFKFDGNRLVLNIDTDATGYAQVGFLDEQGKPIDGFAVDNCVWINGDFLDVEVEWIKNPEVLTVPYGDSIEDVFAEASKLKYTKDVSSLAGKIVQLVIRMRGAKLYAMQFVEK